MARGDAPDTYTGGMDSGNIIQRILRRGRNEQEPSAMAATVAQESPTAMPQGASMPKVPAASAQQQPEYNWQAPENRPYFPSTETASPAAPEVDTVGMPTFDAEQPQQWRGEGDYYYSYKPATGNRPATITFHGGENQRRNPVTISETGSQAAAFSAIMDEARRLNAEGRAGAFKSPDQYAREQGETTNQTVERVANEMIGPEEFSGEYLSDLRRGFGSTLPKNMPSEESSTLEQMRQRDTGRTVPPARPSREADMAAAIRGAAQSVSSLPQRAGLTSRPPETYETLNKQALINRINNAVVEGDSETARQAAYDLSSQFPDDADAQNRARLILMGQ